jgi:hypothetical protein
LLVVVSVLLSLWVSIRFFLSIGWSLVVFVARLFVVVVVFVFVVVGDGRRL